MEDLSCKFFYPNFHWSICQIFSFIFVFVALILTLVLNFVNFEAVYKYVRYVDNIRAISGENEICVLSSNSD